jgi:hypothetical protein
MSETNLNKGYYYLPIVLFSLLSVVTPVSVDLAYAQGDVKPGETAPDVILDRPCMPAFVPGEIIVKMKEGAVLPLEDLQQLGLESTPKPTSGGELIYKLTPEAMKRMEALSAEESRDRMLEIAEKLKANPKVEYAQPNWILQPYKTQQ